MAIAIAAVIIVTVNYAFFQSHKNIEAVKGGREVYQSVRTVMDRMIKDLSCTYLPSDDRQMTKDEISLYRFTGVNDDTDNTDRDTITFTTTTDLGFSKVPGAICEVGYYLKEAEGTDTSGDTKASDETEKVYTLMRREDPTPHYGVTEKGQELEIAEGVTGFNVVYLDETGQEVVEWDLGKRLTLPHQVRITLTLQAGQEELTFTATASLPLAGIRLRTPEG